jgi:hypothetical protein
VSRTTREITQLLHDVFGRQSGHRSVLGTSIAGRQVAERASLDRRLTAARDDFRHRRVRIREPVGRGEEVGRLGFREGLRAARDV